MTNIPNFTQKPITCCFVKQLNLNYMDYLVMVVIVLVTASFFGFYQIARWFFKRLKGAMPGADKASRFVEGQANEEMSGTFDPIVQRLEVARARYAKKTKGLFKRSFFRAWLVLTAVFLTLAFTLSESGEVSVSQVIGPVMMATVLSLIGAGLYTLGKKGLHSTRFSGKFKRELVAAMVKAVNQALTFSAEGISTEAFDRADLFPDNKKTTTLLSEDKISGTVNGTRVVISECLKRGRVIRGRTGVEFKVKGASVPVSIGRHAGEGNRYVDYFKGLFIQIELKHTFSETPLKVLPAKKVLKEAGSGFAVVGAIQYIKPVMPEDRLAVAGDKPYEIYCADKEAAAQRVTGKFIKVLDYIFGKYYQKRETNTPNALFSKLYKERDVLLAVRGDRLYLALGWNRDMFEPGRLLKEDLRQSGVVKEVYDDLLLLNQIIKEVSLFNQIAA